MRRAPYAKGQPVTGKVEAPRTLPFGPDEERVLVTPDLAEIYLATSVDRQRKLNLTTVEKMCRDLKNDRWYSVGDPIQFDVNGRLINGQHRLQAIIASRKPMILTVIRNLPEDAIQVIDTGKPRRPSDMLTIYGHTSAHLKGAALRILLAVKNSHRGGYSGIRGFSHGEILEMARRHPLIDASVALPKPPRGVRPSYVSALHYIGMHLLKRPELAEAWVRSITGGIPAYAGDAAHNYRERMLNAPRNRVAFHEGPGLKLVIHVWNHFARQQPLLALRPPKQVHIDGLDLDLI